MTNREFQSDKDMVDSFELWSKRLGVEPIKKEEDMTEMFKATIVSNQFTETPVAPREEQDFDPFLDAEDYSNNTAIQPIPDDSIDIYNEERVPEYIARLMSLEIPQEDKLSLLGVYESHVNCVSFDELINTVVPIYGGIIWDHPDTKAKLDGSFLPGWKEILFLSENENGNPRIIKASHGALAVHARAMFSLNGWYIWQEPINYKLARNGKTKAFEMYNQDRISAMMKGLKK